MAAFFIPSGQYQLEASGSPITGSFKTIDPPLDFAGRVHDLLLAPIEKAPHIRRLARRRARARVAWPMSVAGPPPQADPQPRQAD